MRGENNCMGPARGRKKGPKRCSGSPKKTEWPRAESEQGDRQRREWETTVHKQDKQRKLSLSRGTNDFLKSTTEQQTWEKSTKTSASRAVLQTVLYILYKISRFRNVLLEILTDMGSVWNTNDGDIKYVFVGCA